MILNEDAMSEWKDIKTNRPSDLQHCIIHAVLDYGHDIGVDELYQFAQFFSNRPYSDYFSFDWDSDNVIISLDDSRLKSLKWIDREQSLLLLNKE